jgi:hypothetical protein
MALPKLIVTELLKTFTSFYATFFTMFQRLLLVFILNQINPVHTTPIYQTLTHFNIILPIPLCFPTLLIRYGFLTKPLYEFLFSTMGSTYPAHMVI